MENMEENQEVEEVEEQEELEQDIKSTENLITEEEVQERINKAVEGRLAREKRSNQDLLKIEETLKAGLGVDTREELLKEINTFYKEKGVEVPDNRSEYEEKVLGRADAEELIKIGDFKILEAEANRIASIPVAKQTAREKESFNTICETLTEQKKKEEFKKNGYDESLLTNKDFKMLESKFNKNVPITEVVDMYNKIYGEPKKPSSPGSAKDNTNSETVKDYYTFEESKKFSREDFDKNPKLFEAVKKSMPKWSRRK